MTEKKVLVQLKTEDVLDLIHLVNGIGSAHVLKTFDVELEED